ncbi:protein serine/threonine phosphatase 2C [Metschnikowia bicuspidata var. bicuspidata NRRL YB-4993]|uniref:Protein serine/threonine phosphatase 2C n=1 Tax=Metschnikowia bicuspidata var. bicuspidata NRRL YB-4993 TaxID=869754 RepID=A0A1A0H504_9ASCO|nr:protein serine/threonine phosphatase 2C [Metschnikowia bicuspidata var. bicuspidata NRRL YB-4993]OBA19159.1 protein serine/threonine phosphatase 2C [Metschnikowia bicuspidata var. bicuspidata NRRL YB-4993]
MRPALLARPLPPCRPAVRHVSDSIRLTPIDRSQKPARSSADLVPHRSYRLRVPLLKSPSHLGHYSSRGNRLSNEDTYSACVLDLAGRTVFSFAVFDGHGGSQCLRFLQARLAGFAEGASPLVASGPAGDAARSALLRKYKDDIGGYWRRWFRHKDANLEALRHAAPQVAALQNIAVPPDDLMLRLPLAHLAADYGFFAQDDNALGSTCTAAYLETVHAGDKGAFLPVYESHFFNRNTVSRLTVAQVGDTKAILVDRHGAAHALTQAHHPSNPAEAARLRRYLASHFMTDSFGEERFVSLANTRAFGDLQFKEMGVTAEPDVAQMVVGDAHTILATLTPAEIAAHTVGGLGGDEAFLLLCTDGVTNELTDQEIADIVMVNFNMRGHLAASPQSCAEEVVRFVEYIGGDDNATCIVLRLSGWGRWPLRDRTGLLRQERLDAYQPRDRG